ncbi:MAG: glycosyltransferase, partial [Fusobacteriaceae bacterium]
MAENISINFEKKKFLLNRNKIKIIISLIAAFLWAAFSYWIARRWIADFDPYAPPFVAHYVVFTIAIIPGFMNMFLVSMILVKKNWIEDTKEEYEFSKKDYPEVDILIAARNESANIEKTINSILSNGYKGKLNIFCIDDGSTDKTFELMQKFNIKSSSNIKNIGKAASLNKLLPLTTGEVIITVDADSILGENALNNIVETYMIHENIVAVAGNIKTINDKTFMQKLQRYDYELAIFAVKTTQGMLNGVLVAQGAFSLYSGKHLREVAYKEVVGEDIVLTWKLLEDEKNIILYDKFAICYTNTPDTLNKFYRQRIRWARGMIEGFKHSPKLFMTKRFSAGFIYCNFLFPLLDFSFVFIYLPALIWALVTMKSNLIVGLITFLVVPLGITQNLLIARKNRCKLDWYFIPFTLIYCIFNQSASL